MNSPVSETLPIDIRALAARLPVRQREGHKGDYGHILVVGGSSGFGGAPGLTALGALRAGAGLVSAAVPASIVNGPIATLAPEAMAHPISAHRGRLRCNKFLTWLYSMRPFDVIAVGPGLGQNEETAGVVHALLEIENRKLVLDADALNIVAASENGFAEVARDVGGGRILTPHPGEAARLLRTDVGTVNADRPAAARRIAELSRSVVVLKGWRTLVCEAGRDPIAVCKAGNPGMATGGSGDVLAGVIAALWGQGMAPFDAACLGVWLHATAGDLAAGEIGEESLVARDIAAHLGQAFRLARGATSCAPS